MSGMGGMRAGLPAPCCLSLLVLACALPDAHPEVRPSDATHLLSLSPAFSTFVGF